MDTVTRDGSNIYHWRDCSNIVLAKRHAMEPQVMSRDRAVIKGQRCAYLLSSKVEFHICMDWQIDVGRAIISAVEQQAGHSIVCSIVIVYHVFHRASTELSPRTSAMIEIRLDSAALLRSMFRSQFEYPDQVTSKPKEVPAHVNARQAAKKPRTHQRGQT